MEGGLEAKIHEGGKLCTFLDVTVTDSLTCLSGFHRLSRRGCRVRHPFPSRVVGHPAVRSLAAPRMFASTCAP